MEGPCTGRGRRWHGGQSQCGGGGRERVGGNHLVAVLVRAVCPGTCEPRDGTCFGLGADGAPGSLGDSTPDAATIGRIRWPRRRGPT